MEEVRKRIAGKLPSTEEQEHINSLSPNQIIDELIYSKGSYVYRASLLKKLLQLSRSNGDIKLCQ